MKYASLILLALSACSTPTFDFPNMSSKTAPLGVAVRGSIGQMSGDLDATTYSQASRNRGQPLTISLDDNSSPYRVDVTKSFHDGSVEVGLFYGAGGPEYERAQLSASDFGLVVRGFVNNDGDLRPYVELRLGVRDMEITGAEPGFNDRVDSGTSVLGGVGLGLEYDLGGGFSIFGQLDGTYTEGTIVGTDILTTEYGAMFGGVWRF